MQTYEAEFAAHFHDNGDDEALGGFTSADHVHELVEHEDGTRTTYFPCRWKCLEHRFAHRSDGLQAFVDALSLLAP